MSEVLRPCLFCGGEAEFERIGDSRKSTIVCCTECGVSQECGEEWGHGRTWNARHIPEGYALVKIEPTEAMISAAEDAYMPFGDMTIAIISAIMEGRVDKHEIRLLRQ